MRQVQLTSLTARLRLRAFPHPGSLFAVGVTTVTCNAKDKATNAAAPKTFTVTVTAPPASGGGSPPPTTTTTPPTAPFTPPALKKPQAVSNFTLTPGDRRVVVVWKLPTGAGLHVELTRTIASGNPKTVYTGAALTFADTHLQNGSQYSYSIVVVDADGNRSDSLSRTVTPSAQLLVSPAPGARVTSPPTLVWVPRGEGDVLQRAALPERPEDPQHLARLDPSNAESALGLQRWNVHAVAWSLPLVRLAWLRPSSRSEVRQPSWEQYVPACRMRRATHRPSATPPRRWCIAAALAAAFLVTAGDVARGLR